MVFGCFFCLETRGNRLNADKQDDSKIEDPPMAPPQIETVSSGVDGTNSINSSNSNKQLLGAENVGSGSENSAQIFSYQELAFATKNFREDLLLGQGGFGRVYKGHLEGQVVAVKKLDRDGLQGNKEFLAEVVMLSMLHHPNLVSLVGYCADGDQRLLVYEYMPLGSLEDHLHDIPADKEPLDWITRMKIATGAAKGLEYLHDTANPPVIYRDLKSANILLDEWFHPKLSDFGLAKHGPVGGKSHVSTRVMGTYGYCAPEYAMTGQLTLKSDIYSFGVVLLELITGRRPLDGKRPHAEQILVDWARVNLNDKRNFPKLVDPRLRGRHPMRGLYQALGVASMCISEKVAARPVIADVVTALSYLASQPYDPNSSIASNDKGRRGSPEGGDATRSEKGDSPMDVDRKRAVAEARSWGKQTQAAAQGSASAAASTSGS